MAQQQMQKKPTQGQSVKRHNEAVRDYEEQCHQDSMRKARRAARHARQVREDAERFLRES